MKTQAIIPAAGQGSRFKGSYPLSKNAPDKTFVSLNGKPLLTYCLKALQECRLIDSIIVVTLPKQHERVRQLAAKFKISKVKAVVSGGKTRADSVRKGLAQLDQDTDLVLVHDGARPLISGKLLEAVIRRAAKTGAAIAAVPVKPTIKTVDNKSGRVQGTLDRSRLWEVQTPQVFKKDLLLRAHRNSNGTTATDDAVLVERLGKKVFVIKGDYRNIKITTEEDLKIAEVFLRRKG